MITTGVTGGRWRALISPWGAILPDDAPPLDWHVAADDRWHSPEHETTVRQRRIDGTAVVETRLRIPDGDAVQRIYSVADHGGLTVIEVENDSPLPIAIAFTSGDLLSPRPPSAPIHGIALPSESVAFPVGHRATLTVAIGHTAGAGPGRLPAGLPTAASVARGWLTTAQRAGQMDTPDTELNERIVATRCELLLTGAPLTDDDAFGSMFVIDQLVRMGEAAEPFVPQLAYALERVSKAADRDWQLAAALAAADRVLAAAGEARARRDLAALRRRLHLAAQLPHQPPLDPVRALAWAEQRMVAWRDGQAQLLAGGLPASWFGHNFEVFNLPTDCTGTISFALRWHGERPAVLWEQSPGADGSAMLTSPILAPEWSSAEGSGEALWDKYNL